jgi:hypothetical protein
MRCCWSKDPEGRAENIRSTAKRVQGCSRSMHRTPVAKEMAAVGSSHQVYQWFAGKILGRGSQEYQIDSGPYCLGISGRDEVDCSYCELVR